MPVINQTEYENVLVQITSINGYYTIPIISLVGFLLNSTCLVVFLNPKFNYKNETNRLCDIKNSFWDLDEISKDFKKKNILKIWWLKEIWDLRWNKFKKLS